MDSDGKFRKEVADFLKKNGYTEVLETNKSSEVLKEHVANPFNLVIVEWEIQDLGGDLFLRKIAKHNGRKCRIVVIFDGSSSVHIETKVGCYLVKPLEAQDFDKLLR